MIIRGLWIYGMERSKWGCLGEGVECGNREELTVVKDTTKALFICLRSFRDVHLLVPGGSLFSGTMST
jgi:hypothetical protein